MNYIWRKEKREGWSGGGGIKENDYQSYVCDVLFDAAIVRLLAREIIAQHISSLRHQHFKMADAQFRK